MSLYTPSLRGQLPRHIVRQFQSPYTPSPRGLSRISERQVALALASRFSRMLSFQIKDMEFTGAKQCFHFEKQKNPFFLLILTEISFKKL
jgi:hypothetical protein